MRECAELGIKHVWMHRGPGAGSVSETAAAYGRERGIAVIDGGCPVHVRPDRRSRSQGDAPDLHPDRQRPEASLILGGIVVMKRYEYKVIDTGKHIEQS